ncbi:MAG: 3-deoxy-manno-octulosonate cytidylyltransferase [Planctomycetota bacterium]|nr:3-deoxy-manno-octulosonate cytidylyltransferase [Planctomycetota bacterium]
MRLSGESLRALAVLPARIGSTRLARKVLLAETGRPLVVHTAETVTGASRITRVVVATDDAEVLAAVTEHGHEAVMTRDDHPSGTDRVNEAAQLTGEGWDVVVNVQADEPELDPADLDRLVDAFEDADVEIATLAAPLAEGELETASVVKVVRDDAGDALYFSRAAIPCADHARDDDVAPGLRHVGVYAFRPEALAAFCALPVGRLERTENLEQLRWLEAGRRMRVLDAARAPRGIDTLEDYRAFVQRTGVERADSEHRTTNPQGGIPQ